MKRRKKPDRPAQRDQHGRARREADQEIHEIAARSRQIDFHPTKPPHPKKYRESEQNGNAVGSEMQDALRWLGYPLMPEGKFQRKPQERDNNEVEPCGRGSPAR